MACAWPPVTGSTYVIEYRQLGFITKFLILFAVYRLYCWTATGLWKDDGKLNFHWYIYQTEGVQSKEIQLFSDWDISLMALIVPALQLFACTRTLLYVATVTNHFLWLT